MAALINGPNSYLVIGLICMATGNYWPGFACLALSVGCGIFMKLGEIVDAIGEGGMFIEVGE